MTVKQSVKQREYQKKWEAENRERRLEYGRRYREKNREVMRLKSREAMRARRARDPEGERCRLAKWREGRKEQLKEYRRSQNLRLLYGMTVEQWEALFESQNCRCAICGSDYSGDKRGRWHTDHCHATGTIRGILCHHCNNMLGAAKDSPATLENAIKYLKRYDLVDEVEL